ncbi:phosphatase PAP2 family protein [Mycoplasma putrefaciens]|uniref:phosphatase PAP2 family protein n=1 Tax=Mycoplasma putrefaciens TaxID=2123 RepID=UPI003DA2E3B2
MQNKLKPKTGKNTTFWVMFISISILFLLALIGFIISTPYKTDFKISQFFEKALEYEIFKYWAVFYEMLGNTLLAPFICFALMVIVESWFLYKSQNNQMNFFSKNRWIVKALYLFLLVLFLIVVSVVSYLQLKQGNGFGPEGDAVFLMSSWYRKIAIISMIILDLIIMVVGFCLIHFKFARSKDFLVNQYWIQAIKILLFAALSYIVVVFLKGLTSRPYYYNVIYGDLLEKLKNQGHADWVEHYLNQSSFRHGFDIGDGKFDHNISDDWPWYVINGSAFKPAKNLALYKNWVEWAFPSGHLIATLTIGTTFFFFLSNNKKLTYKKIIWLLIFLLHLLSMTFALIVDRGHWFSDVSFSYLFGLPLIWIVNKIGIKIQQKINDRT